MLDKRTLPIGTLISYLFLYIAAIVAQFVLIYISGLDPFNESDFLRMGSISNLAGYGTAFIILYVLYFKYLRRKFKETMQNINKTLLYVIGGFVALYLLAAFVSIIYQIIGITSIPENQEQLNAFGDAMLFDKIALSVYAIILAPFVEEMVFRLGLITLISNLFIHSRLDKRIVIAIAIIISSFAFGYIHVTGDLEQIGNYAALGAVLGLVYYKTDNVYISIFVHMLYNGIAAYAMFF